MKNLGVELRPDGEVKLPRKTWDSYLTNISAAHLNPIQKVDAICQVIIAKIQYQLRLSDHGLEEARKKSFNQKVSEENSPLTNLGI